MILSYNLHKKTTMKKLFFALMVLILSTVSQAQVLSTLPDGTVTNNTHFAGVEVVGGVKTTYKYSIASLTALIGGAFTATNIGNSDLSVPSSGVTRQFNLLNGTFKLFKVGSFCGLNASADTLFNFTNQTCFFNRTVFMKNGTSTMILNDNSLEMAVGGTTGLFTKDSIVLDDGNNYRLAMDVPNAVFGILGHQATGDATTDIRAGFKMLPSGVGQIKLKGEFNSITISPTTGDGTVRHFTTPPRSGEFMLAGDGILPGIVFSGGAGTGPALISQTGDDRSGTILFQTGTSCINGALILRVTFSSGYSSNVRVVISPKTTVSAVALSTSAIWITDDAVNYFDINCGGSPGVALSDHTQYYFTYMVMK